MKWCVSSGRLSSISFVWLVLAGLGLGSSCETITEKVTQKVTESALEHVIEKETGGKVDIAEGSVTYQGDKGKVAVGAGAKVPEDWPQDVPVYPGSKVTMTMSNGGQHVLSLETADSPDKAVEYYKSKLSGLKQEGTMATEQQTMISYKDEKSGRRVQLSIGKESGGAGPNTTIALIVTADKKSTASAK